MPIQFTVRMHTTGNFQCKVLANNKDEAYEISTGIWEEADFGVLENAEMESFKAEEERENEWLCTFSTTGHYDYEIISSCEDTIEIISKAKEEGWEEASFGELYDIDIEYSEITEEYEL